MKKLKPLFLALLFVTINIFAQEKGIYLAYKKTKKFTFLKENYRTKVITTDGKRMVGKLKIIDENTINIDNIDIPIESVIKIRRASMFHAIADPFAVSLGAVLVVGGIYLISLGGDIATFFATTFLLSGIPTLVIPFIKNNHPTEKWEYQIIYNNQ